MEPRSPGKGLVVDDKSTLLSKGAANAAPLQFALVGLGRAGSFHLTSLRAMSDQAAIRWVVDVDAGVAERIGLREGCQWSACFEDAFSDPQVDAVIIASSTDSHAPLCKAALEAGKAVFTEKPISHDPTELSEIVELAISSKLPFIVGYQRRVDRNFRELRRQVRDARSVGQVRLIKCCSRDNPIPPLEYLKISGGIFNDMLCHDFDMIHFLCDEMPVEVYSAGHCYDADIAKLDDLDMVVVTLKFPSGLLATVDCSRVAAYGYDQRVEVFGDGGMATAHNQEENTVVVAGSSGFLHPPSQWSFPQRYKHTYTAELAEFIALIRHGGVEPEALVRRHVSLAVVTAAAEISWRLNRAVRLDEVDQHRHLLEQKH